MKTFISLFIFLLAATVHGADTTFPNRLVGDGAGLTNLASWTDISEPEGWAWPLPFTVQQNGTNFRPSPAFDLQYHSAIGVTNTYYVAGGGSDAAAGTSWATALATLGAAFAKANVDQVYASNVYSYRNQAAGVPARNVQVIGFGTNVFMTSDQANRAQTWVQYGTMWSNRFQGEFVSTVYDDLLTNIFGLSLLYTNQSTVLAVSNNPGSYFWSGGSLYLRTKNDRTPVSDAGLRYYDSAAFGATLDNRKFYFENVNFRGGVVLNGNSSAGGFKAYFKGGSMMVLTAAGLAEVILQNVNVWNYLSDGANYDVLNGIPTKAIEINCDMGFIHGTAGNLQASTAHNGSTMVSIGGKYHDVPGQCIADAGVTTTRWALGVEVYNSRSGIGFYTEGRMWLDHCWSHGNASFDVQNIAGAITYERNLVSGGLFDIGGLFVHGYPVQPSSLIIPGGGTNSLGLTVGGTAFVVVSNQVGIGTATPTATLHTKSAAGLDNGVIFDTTSANQDSYFSLQEAGVEKWRFRNQGDSSDKFRLASETNPNVMSIGSNGWVGLGMVVPSSSLDMTGQLRAASAIFTNGITVPSGGELTVPTLNVTTLNVNNLVITNGPKIFTQTNTVTVTNVTASTGLLSGKGTTNITAGRLVVGDTIRINLYGIYSTDAAPGGTTLTMRVLLNGSVACQTPVDAPPSGHNAQAWRLTFDAVVRKIGASGIVMPGGMMTYGRGVATSSDVQGMPSAATFAVDTTAAITVSVDASLNNTTDAIGISCQGGTIEIIQ